MVLGKNMALIYFACRINGREIYIHIYSYDSYDKSRGFSSWEWIHYIFGLAMDF